MNGHSESRYILNNNTYKSDHHEWYDIQVNRIKNISNCSFNT